MAQYDIVSLNYITSGPRRGFLDLTLRSSDKTGMHLTLLDKTFEAELDDGTLSGVEHTPVNGEDGIGIVTESGEHDFLRTDYIEDYPLRNIISALGLSSTRGVILLNETQRLVDVESLSGSFLKDIGKTEDGRISGRYDEGSLLQNPPLAIQLLTSVDYEVVDPRARDELACLEYNNSLANIHKVFEFERHADPNVKNVISSPTEKCLPLNDVIDISIKSSKRKRYTNPNVPHAVGDGTQNNNRNIDIYMTLDSNPVGMCQYGNNTMLLTDETVNGAYYLNTTLRESREIPEYKEYYTWKLSRKQIATDLYPTSADNQNHVPLSTYLSSHIFVDDAIQDAEFLQGAIAPKKRMTNIRYNVLLNVDQDINPNQYLDNEMIYDDGNIPGDFMSTKNMYNATYSMDMDSQDSIRKCRKYCGLINTNGKLPVLKYYDVYTYRKTSEQYDEDTQMQTCGMTPDQIQQNGYPYQKIEYVYPTQSMNQCRHKSNLFSIKISNTGLMNYKDTSREDGLREKFLQMMRKDIDNNIKQMVDSICPANTQLFKTIYVD